MIKLPSESMQRILEDPVRTRSEACYVYFVKCNSYVKIGHSINPICRTHDIQVGSPYKCKLLCYTGFTGKAMAKDYEEYLHNKFEHLNKRGEWFKLTKEIKDYIKENNYAMV